MGLFDFVKDAGVKLFGGAKPAEKKTEVLRTPDTARADKEKGYALWKLVSDMKLPVQDFEVKFQGGKATLTGKVESQEAREKVVLLVGNTQGVAQVDDRLQVAKAAPEATMYTVKSGDTLSKISKQQYGDAMKYMVIFEANKPMLKDPDKIYPGQVLRIPPLEKK